MEDKNEIQAEVDKALREAGIGLNRILDRVEDEIITLEEQLADLKETRKFLVKSLDRINPGPPKSGKNKQVGVHRLPRESDAPKIVIVEKFIKSKFKTDEFMAVDIKDALPLKNGEKPISIDAVRRCLDALHDRGVIRLDRKSQGGGSVYKLVS